VSASSGPFTHTWNTRSTVTSISAIASEDESCLLKVRRTCSQLTQRRGMIMMRLTVKDGVAVSGGGEVGGMVGSAYGKVTSGSEDDGSDGRDISERKGWRIGDGPQRRVEEPARFDQSGRRKRPAWPTTSRRSSLLRCDQELFARSTASAWARPSAMRTTVRSRKLGALTIDP
jgi:hypothetical protein